jgi:uncharacterized protein YfaT (DUF1175 family)
MTLRAVVEDYALSKVGVVESPAGSNIVEFNDKYYDSDAIGCDFKNYFGAVSMYKAQKKKGSAGAFAWCGSFVASCFLEASRAHEGSWMIDNSLYYRLYYVPTAKNWLESKGKRVELEDAQKGDIIIFDWNADGNPEHIGIVLSVKGDYINTVEGNTSPDKKGSQSNGGMVCLKRRHKHSVFGIYNIIGDE